MALAFALACSVAPAAATPVLVAATAATQVTPADQAAILAAHNNARQEVGVAALVWDDALATDAQAWVDFLIANRGGELDHGSNADALSSAAKNQGENLNAGRPPGDMTIGWYAEKAAFDASPDKTVQNGISWGHYSQMVWSTTTNVGCGTAPGGPFGRVNACRYSPGGNFLGQPPFTAPAGGAPQGGPQNDGAQTGGTGGTQNEGTDTGGTGGPQNEGTQTGAGAAPTVTDTTSRTFACAGAPPSTGDGTGNEPIEVVNNSTQTLRFFFIDFQGQKQEVSGGLEAAPGVTTTLNGRTGDKWLIETADGACITGVEGAGTVTIG